MANKRFASLFTVENAAPDGNGYTNLVQLTPDGTTITANVNGVLSVPPPTVPNPVLKFSGRVNGDGGDPSSAKLFDLGNAAYSGADQSGDPATGYPIRAGVAKNLRVCVSDTNLTGTTTVTVFKNGAPTTLTVTIPAGDFAIHNDLVHTVTFAAGDKMHFEGAINGGADTGHHTILFGTIEFA